MLIGSPNMEKWIDFFEQFFGARPAAEDFVSALEVLDRDSPKHRAKIMMHQVQRLVSLADDVDNIRPGKESLQLMFLMICAENIAKLFHNFDEVGKSRSFVRRFFNEFVNDEDRGLIEGKIVDENSEALDLQKVVDTLYSVRCDVVHEGFYWCFDFHDGNTPMITGDPHITVHLKLSTLRYVIVRASINAISQYGAP